MRILLTVLAIAAGSAAPVSAEPMIAVAPFAYLDTSGEPTDQSADHARRILALQTKLTSGLSADARFDAASIQPAASDCGQVDCTLRAAREAKADLVLVGAVQKISTMATRAWIGIFDTETEKRVWFRELNFRRDTDDAWDRASGFILKQIDAATDDILRG